MVSVEFATSSAGQAARYIRKAYPDATLTDADLEPVLELVREGLVRVRDPKMYGNAALIPGDEWDESRRSEVVTAGRKLKEAADG